MVKDCLIITKFDSRLDDSKREHALSKDIKNIRHSVVVRMHLFRFYMKRSVNLLALGQRDVILVCLITLDFKIPFYLLFHGGSLSVIIEFGKPCVAKISFSRLMTLAAVVIIMISMIG